MSNLDLWNSVCRTDPAHTKRAKIGGMNITAIDPQYQRKNATETFGPFGQGFGLDNPQYTTHIIGDTTILQFDAELWFVWKGERGVFPVTSQVKMAYMKSDGSRLIVDDDAAKKAQTDALTKGLSMLGFNSDVFEGLFDDNKYVEQVGKEIKAREQEKQFLALAEKTQPTLKAVCEALDNDDFSTAKEALGELDEDEQKSVWIAPSNLSEATKEHYAYLTTAHRAKIKSNEWAAA